MRTGNILVRGECPSRAGSVTAALTFFSTQRPETGCFCPAAQAGRQRCVQDGFALSPFIRLSFLPAGTVHCNGCHSSRQPDRGEHRDRRHVARWPHPGSGGPCGRCSIGRRPPPLCFHGSVTAFSRLIHNAFSGCTQFFTTLKRQTIRPVEKACGRPAERQAIPAAMQKGCVLAGKDGQR